MRIVFASQEFPPETGWGGIGTYVDVISEALAATGAEVHVLSTVPGQARSTAVVGGVTVHRFGQIRLRGVGRLTRHPESARRVSTAWSVARLLAQLPGPATVECPEWQAEGLFLGLRGRVPLVVRLHSAARQLFPYTGQGKGAGGADGRRAAWLEDESARRADLVTSMRANLAQAIPELGLDPGATRAIANPVRLPAVRAPAPGGPPTVTFVGRLEPRKGPETLLRAAPRVIEAVPDARFVLVGRDGVAAGRPSSTAWLKDEARRLGVAGHVEFAGQLDRAGVQARIADATVCAFPSRWESFGLAAAEAAAMGRFLVTSDIPAYEDLVDPGRTGRRVPVDDDDAWSEALIGALTDPQAAHAGGIAGARLVRALSDPATVAEQTAAAHQEAQSRWRSARARR